MNTMAVKLPENDDLEMIESDLEEEEEEE